MGVSGLNVFSETKTWKSSIGIVEYKKSVVPNLDVLQLGTLPRLIVKGQETILQFLRFLQSNITQL